jgi:hypothetical protein
MNIARKVVRDEGNGIIMNTKGRRKALGSGKNSFMFEENGLEVKRYRGCLSGMNGMELCNNVEMTFF